MANLFSSFLNNLGQGLLKPKGNMGDFTHAAKLYNDSAFRLAPKQKFLYHVVFNFGPTALAKTSFSEQHQTTVGLLVKSVDLPKFKMTVDTVQQYNRKKNVQTKLDYEPITIQLHDDNLGVSTALWAFYYGYYFADSANGGSAGAAAGTPGGLSALLGSISNFVSKVVPGMGVRLGNPYQGNGSVEATRPAAYYTTNTIASDVKHKYGLDRDSSLPFFTSIQIFQMGKQQYQCYTLINPIITGWQHDKLENSDDSATATNTMQIAYEAVIYGTGRVSSGNPKGFAKEFYDKSPSPLSLLGGGAVGLFGQGGILGSGADLLGSITSGAAFTSPTALLGTLVKGAAVVNGAKKLTKEGIRREAFGIVEGSLSRSTGLNLSGISNVVFPKNKGAGQSQTTTATPKNPTPSTGALPINTVSSYFASRPTVLESLAKNTVFQKDIKVGSLNEVNARWAALSPAAKATYTTATIQRVSIGAPEVQYHYNEIIKGRT